MKKIVSTADLGGAPFFKQDMREVFNSEIWDVIEGLLSKYDTDTEGLIISGCVFSNNAGNFDMTAGIVYLNGEFMRIPAATNQAYTKYIAAATATEDSRTYADGSTNGLVETKNAELIGAAPGSGQYITINSLTGAEERRFANMLPSNGIYTPTLTNTTNVSASTAYECQYMRVGNVVTVSGKVSIDPTAGSATTELEMSLPIPSNFATQQQCGGTAVNAGATLEAASIRASASNDRAFFFYRSAASAANEDFFFTFTYLIV